MEWWVVGFWSVVRHYRDGVRGMVPVCSRDRHSGDERRVMDITVCLDYSAMRNKTVRKICF
jgi:hypothetical protein